MTNTASLRSLVADHPIQVPGAPSALFARLIEEAGYEACYVSGAAFSAGVLALPDVGLFTLSELTQHVAQLTARVSIPVIVDADTGFGGPPNVERTVYELFRAGADAIQLEDQELPKRCGHLPGKKLVSAEEMCAKLRAAAAVRPDEETILIARTDARQVEGIDAAIERANAYLAAGADWIFPEALESAEEFRTFASKVDATLVANMTEFGKSPLLEFEALAELGYRVVLYPVTLLRFAMRAAEAALTILSAEGTQHNLLDLMQTREELYQLLDYDVLQDRDPNNSD